MSYARATGGMYPDASIANLVEKAISDYTVERWFEESMLNDISTTTPFQILSGGGTSVVFKKYGKAAVSAYTANTDIDYSTTTADTVTLDLDRAFYGAYYLDDADRIAIQNVDKEGLKRIAKKLAMAHDENHFAEAIAYLLTGIRGKSVMANADALSGLFYKGVANDLTVRTKLTLGATDDATTRYVLDPFIKARTARKRKNVPKELQLFALVPPELFELIEQAEQFHYLIGGKGNQSEMTENGLGRVIRVKGFDIVETNQLSIATFDTKTLQAPIIFGCKEGFAFYPQFERTENLRLEKRFADAVRQLSLFGLGFSDERMFGIDYIKMPA